MKKRMKYANKIQARFVVIVNADAIENNTVILKDLHTGNQEDIDLNSLYTTIQKEI